VIAHARDLSRVAAKDWRRRTRAAVPGARVRQVAVLASLAAGLASPWRRYIAAKPGLKP
jgi:hypothetical protein